MNAHPRPSDQDSTRHCRVYPLLIVNSLLKYGCRITVAAAVTDAISEYPVKDQMVLWMRMQGMSYRHIGEVVGSDPKSVWRSLHGPVRKAVYGLLEEAVQES